MGAPHRRALGGFAGQVPGIPDLPSPLPGVAQAWRDGKIAARAGHGSFPARQTGCIGNVHRWHLRECKKRGACVGKTKRGKGTKIMAIADSSGLPLAVSIASASPHEGTLVEQTLAQKFIDAKPERMIGDKAYDNDPLDARLANEQNIELIAPNR